MHRRTLGRGRWLAGIAAAIVVIGALLPWYSTGGGPDLPVRQIGALGGPGIIVVLAALATIALLTLPYAAGDHPVAIERPLSYGLLFGLAVIGLVLFVSSVIDGPLFGLLPDRAPGLWISGAGVLVLARAVYEIATEPPRF